MKKESHYFPHDCNARNDEKLLAVRMRYGAEGYGIYFMIIERLRDSSDYFHVADYNIIAFDLRVETGRVKSIIEDFGLFVFTDDGKYFYSETLLSRMKPLDNLRNQRVEAGKKSAKIKGFTDVDVVNKVDAKNDRSTTVQRPFNDRSTVDSTIRVIKEDKNNNTEEEKHEICFSVPVPEVEKKDFEQTVIKTTEEEKEKSSAKKEKEEKKRNLFIRPTLAEVSDYCKERCNAIDPQQWIDYYTANGWRVGKNPMQDWKAAVRTWERNGITKEINNGNNREKGTNAPTDRPSAVQGIPAKKNYTGTL